MNECGLRTPGVSILLTACNHYGLSFCNATLQNIHKHETTDIDNDFL